MSLNILGELTAVLLAKNLGALPGLDIYRRSEGGFVKLRTVKGHGSFQHSNDSRSRRTHCAMWR
eukprot:10380723-Prorocentrum_lima.AAC.1